jgi:hypothetical protein
VLSDPAVAKSYGASPTLAQVDQTAKAIDWSWRHDRVHKWLANDRVTCERLGMHHAGQIGGDGPTEGIPDDTTYGPHPLARRLARGIVITARSPDQPVTKRAPPRPRRTIPNRRKVVRPDGTSTTHAACSP